MSDIVQRSKAALEGITEGPWKAVNAGNIHWGVSSEGYDFPTVVKAQCSYDGFGNGSRRVDAEFIAAAPELVRELVAEVEQLQAGGAWVEHVERQRAMKRERDGECICNIGPDTDGPDEFCPWHGRRYAELVNIIVRQQSEINELTGL